MGAWCGAILLTFALALISNDICKRIDKQNQILERIAVALEKK